MLSAIVVILLLVLLGYLVHGVLLAGDYNRLPALYRTPDEQTGYFPLMLPAHVAAAVAMVWLFRRIRNQDPPLIQGLRFGLAIAALVPIPKFLIYFALQPLPASLLVKQMVFDSIASLIIGVVLAFLYAGRERRT